MRKVIFILVSAPVKDKKVSIQDFLFLENLFLTIVLRFHRFLKKNIKLSSKKC